MLIVPLSAVSSATHESNIDNSKIYIKNIANIQKKLCEIEEHSRVHGLYDVLKKYRFFFPGNIYESCPKSIFYPMLKAVRFFFEINKFSKNLVIIS